MEYPNGMHAKHPRPFNNVQPPFANRPMFPHIMGLQRVPSFRPPRLRGMPRRGAPHHRMMRPGFTPEHLPMRLNQPVLRPPYTMNRPIFSSNHGNDFKNTFDAKTTFNGQQEPYGQFSHIQKETKHMENGLNDNSSQEIFACDSCDRNFPSETAFNKHMSEHRVCGLEGCTFTAHVKIIEKHIEMQHKTGIFERMKNLDSPENVAKWLEERKAKFPSKENIEKRHKQQEELWKKGIRIGEKKHKLGKDNNKTRMVPKDPQTRQKERDNFFKKKQEKRHKVIKKYQPKLLIDEKSDWNGNLPPFRGIIELFSEKDEEKFTISDDEEDYTKIPTKIEDLVKVNSSLGALMAYGSDYSEDEEELPSNNVKNEKQVNENQISENRMVDVSDKKDETADKRVDSDDEGPLEVKIERTTTLTENTISAENKKPDELKNKTRKRKSNNKSKDQSTSKKIKTQNFPRPFHIRKISHLEKILDEDIRRERNIILQCVRHTVENHFYMKSLSKYIVNISSK